jgi:ABC-type transporter Mla MlaB component
MDLGTSDRGPWLKVPAPIGRADVPALCERAERVLKAGPGSSLDCDVADLGSPDLATIEALARVELTAMRLGGDIRLRGASVELLELLALCGLPIELALEAEGQPEQREEAGRVEEERDPTDPVA